MRSSAPLWHRRVLARLGAALAASVVVFGADGAEAALPVRPATLVRTSPRQPEASSPLHRGAELVAIRDLELHRARIAEGARVTVVEVRFAHGAPVAVSLALPDGYVLHDIAYERVTQSFRPTRG